MNLPPVTNSVFYFTVLRVAYHGLNRGARHNVGILFFVWRSFIKFIVIDFRVIPSPIKPIFIYSPILLQNLIKLSIVKAISLLER